MNPRPVALPQFLLLTLAAVASGCLVGERPVAPDADGDGLPDAAEAAGWNVTVIREAMPCDAPPNHQRANTTYHVVSNMYFDDNDTDGLTDAFEFSFQTDPNERDTDGDGLSDKEEWDLRQEKDRFFQRTVLWGGDVDSDQDCLTDYQEVKEGFVIEKLGRRVFSDPTTKDGDRDGWTDVEEIFTHFTDPLNPDTDGDGARDRLDVDPHRDTAVWLELETLRVTRSGVERVQFFGQVAEHNVDSNQSFPVTANQANPVPPELSPGLLDVDDLIGDTSLTIRLHWVAVDSDGQLSSILDFSPDPDDTSLTIRVTPARDEWTAGGDSKANACTFDGADGQIVLTLRVGAAGTDPAQWADQCAA